MLENLYMTNKQKYIYTIQRENTKGYWLSTERTSL